MAGPPTSGREQLKVPLDNMHLTGWVTEESAYFRAAQSRLLSARRGDLRLAVVGCSGR